MPIEIATPATATRSRCKTCVHSSSAYAISSCIGHFMGFRDAFSVSTRYFLWAAMSCSMVTFPALIQVLRERNYDGWIIPIRLSLS